MYMFQVFVVNLSVTTALNSGITPIKYIFIGSDEGEATEVFINALGFVEPDYSYVVKTKYDLNTGTMTIDTAVTMRGDYGKEN